MGHDHAYIYGYISISSERISCRAAASIIIMIQYTYTLQFCADCHGWCADVIQKCWVNIVSRCNTWIKRDRFSTIR